MIPRRYFSCQTLTPIASQDYGELIKHRKCVGLSAIKDHLVSFDEGSFMPQSPDVLPGGNLQTIVIRHPEIWLVPFLQPLRQDIEFH